MENKPTLTLMCGLPRSGKSTWIKNNCKDNVVVSPDRIRKLIFGHQFHRDAEDFVWAYAKGMAKMLLEQGKSVIIDATNTNFIDRQIWYSIAINYKAKIRIVWIKTSLKECKKRNEKSPNGEKLPEEALNRIAYSFCNPTSDLDMSNFNRLGKIYGFFEKEIIELPSKSKSECNSSNIYKEETKDY